MTNTRLQVRIEGKVQGVWYRAWTEQKARSLGLKGWVRNRHDGAVEALFIGPADHVEAMQAACMDGPENARVSAIHAIPEATDPATTDLATAQGAERAFVRLPTA